LKQFYHNPRVGGSSPSSATISYNIINILQRFKKDFEAFFRYTPLTHFLGGFQSHQTISFYSDWMCLMPVLREDIVLIMDGAVKPLPVYSKYRLSSV
jgi:hypothetical protein